jgi:hypothetical protein
MISNWYKSETGNEEQPVALDNTSSNEYVYVRRNFERVEVENQNTEEDPDAEPTYKWVYEEQKVSKEDWNTYESIIQNENNIKVNDGGLLDLADIISSHDDAISDLAEIVSDLVEQVQNTEAEDTPATDETDSESEDDTDNDVDVEVE